MGVVAYLVIPFVRDVFAATGFPAVAELLMTGPVRLSVALAFIWIFTGVNLLGLKIYERTLIPLMIFMFLCGSVVIFAGFSFDHADFAAFFAGPAAGAEGGRQQDGAEGGSRRGRSAPGKGLRFSRHKRGELK